LRGASLFALAALLALAFAGAAQAANPVPNPGFETSAGDPCNTPAQWSPLGGGFGCPAPILRDTVVFHSGSASMKIGVDATSSSNTPDLSDCFALGGGTYNASYWYRTDDATVSGTMFLVRLYSDPTGCKGVPTTQTLNVSASGGAWVHVTGQLTFPVGTHFAQLQLGMSCSCGAPSIINFDDVSLDVSNPTATAVTGFAALRSPHRVALHWRTASEVGIAGFHVFRESAGRLIRLDARLVPVTRGRQSFVDTAPPARGTVYRLQIVRLDGSRSWAAAAAVRGR
jgi:hypothetical protein